MQVWLGTRYGWQTWQIPPTLVPLEPVVAFQQCGRAAVAILIGNFGNTPGRRRAAIMELLAAT